MTPSLRPQNPPVGTFSFTGRNGYKVEVTLQHDLVWTSTVPEVAEYLNAFYGPSADDLLLGPMGTGLLALAAQDLQAKPVLHEVYVPDPKVIA